MDWDWQIKTLQGCIKNIDRKSANNGSLKTQQTKLLVLPDQQNGMKK